VPATKMHTCRCHGGTGANKWTKKVTVKKTAKTAKKGGKTKPTKVTAKKITPKKAAPKKAAASKGAKCDCT